jgi:DNA polymerase III epsilon subunit-like protein
MGNWSYRGVNMDFVAIDFETANSFRGSACEIALVRVSGGKVVETFETLLNQKDFSGFNTMLHGITPKMVLDAPRIEDVWPSIREFIGLDPIVAHYAAFDTGVLRDSLGLNAFSEPLSYFCTVVLSRRILQLPSYRLPWVADELGIPFKETHRSLTDAMAVAEIVMALGEKSGIDSLSALADSVGVRPGLLSTDGWKGSIFSGSSGGSLSAAQRAEILKSIPESELYEDPDFVGLDIVFTGAMGSMTRDEAMLRVMKAGGIPKTAVTKKTNMLVFGHQDSAALRPGASVSNKMAKALELIEEGANLEIVDEETFLQMLSSPDGHNV